MHRLDETYPFKPLRFAVLVVSDSRDLASDKSGATLQNLIEDASHTLAERTIVTDDLVAIRTAVEDWIADPCVNVILTTGGTGLTGRDITPEAVKPLFDKEIEGFSAIFHRVSYEQVGTSTIQSRACGGVARGTYVFCLPGSPGACEDAWKGILKWQFDSRHRPCNLVQIMPRLQERHDVRAAETIKSK
jgi:molybdenum cofactor biosynthesis protein B